MFDLEKEVQRWRKREERGSSLSVRELDELEDHLRARIDLELQLNPMLAPARAFRVAREDLGEPAALSKEFAKAGKPRWKRLMVAGWMLFGGSFFLTALDADSLRFFRPPPPPPGTTVPVPTTAPERMVGREAFTESLSGFLGLFGILSALTNILMLVIGFGVLGRWTMNARWTVPIVAGAAGGNVLLWMPAFTSDLRVGYYAWVASFACVAIALWLREREWAPARAREELRPCATSDTRPPSPLPPSPPPPPPRW